MGVVSCRVIQGGGVCLCVCVLLLGELGYDILLLLSQNDRGIWCRRHCRTKDFGRGLVGRNGSSIEQLKMRFMSAA